MILLVHLLFGAAIGSIVKNIPLGIILAFLSHYLLDLIPHIDYPLKNIEKKQWNKSIYDFSKVALDLFTGCLLAFLFSSNQPIIYICAFFAILPDGITLLTLLLKNKILEKHLKFHIEKAHFFHKNEKISKFWRLFSQMAVVCISLMILFFLK